MLLCIAELRSSLILAAVIILLIILSYHLTWGWYILVFLSPLIQWELSLAFLRPWFPSAPWFFTMHAPIVEFWTVLMLVAFGFNVVRRWVYGNSVRLYAPALVWFIVFVGSAALSIVNVLPHERLGGIKYIFHFMLLFYVGYLVLGTTLVNTKALWQRSLKILALDGLLAACMGAASLVLGVWQGDGFHRVVPFAIGGWQPFGDQHIFLAEMLTTALPIYVYFWYITPAAQGKKWWGGGAWVVATIALLTLSRAGWITLLVEAVVFFYLTRDHQLWQRIFYRWWLVGAAVIIPVAIYLGYFLTTSPVARGSTQARWYFTEAALYMFAKHPMVGQGVWSFVPRAREIAFLVNHFGTPTDALGIIQKILAEQGLVGLVTFGLFIGWIIKILVGRLSNTNYTPEARAAYVVSLFLVLSPAIFQLFNTLFYTSKMWVPIALALSESILYHGETGIPRLLINLKPRLIPVVTEI